MFHPDELRDEHGRWTARGLLAHGITIKSAGRVQGAPAQAVYHNGNRVGTVLSKGGGKFTALHGNRAAMEASQLAAKIRELAKNLRIS